MSSIFTKIIAGEIPSYKVYEDKHTYAFLDIHPIQKGHTLVIPKVEVDHLLDVPEPYYSACFTTAKIVGNILQQSLNPQRIGMKVIGFDVPHAHIHMVPMYNQADMYTQPADTVDHEALAAVHAEILAHINTLDK